MKAICCPSALPNWPTEHGGQTLSGWSLWCMDSGRRPNSLQEHLLPTKGKGRLKLIARTAVIGLRVRYNDVVE